MQSEIINNSLNDLEYSEVLKLVSKFCHSEKTNEMALNIKPFTNKDDLKKSIGMVGEMIDLIEHEENLSFEGFEDVSHLFKKSLVPGSVLNTDEVLDVQEVMTSSRRIKNYFKNINQVYPLLIEFASELYENRSLEKKISDIINENGEIKDNASPELMRIRRELNDKSIRLRNRIHKILKKTLDDEIAQEDFVTIREDRFVIPIKATNKRQFEGIIHGVSQTGQTVFLEPTEIIEMNNDLSLLKNAEKREIYRLLETLTGQISVDAHQYMSSIELLAELDLTHAKARYAIEYKGYKPKISDSHRVELKDVRHPLLVHRTGFSNVVPLTAEIDENTSGYVISGPNAGGKTVALKTIGLSVAMACSGIYPLGECETDLRKIFTSIGDNQSIENDLSTFSSQISQIKDIFDHADPESLVLIDEICSGTDPHEGSALACGILDAFIDYKIDFITTTHQSTLKNYALNNDKIKNASLEFDQKNLKPTYKFLSGVPGSSYAFNLAQSMGLNETILKRAEKYTFEGQLDLEKSINQLNEARNEARELQANLEKELRQAQAKENDYKSRLKDFNIRKSDLLQQAKEEAAEIVSSANRVVENTIREIKESEKDHTEVRKEFRETRNKIVEVAKEVKEEIQIEPGEIKAGDNVTMTDSDNVGIVISIEGKQALVEFNGLKFKVKLNKLQKTAKKVKDDTVSREVISHIKFDTSASIDIRGMRADEGIRKIDRHISDALASSLSEITVLHGKGTGALRNAIREFLDNHHLVNSYREGKMIEGGSGVTIVEL